jgi:hypothetical protein
MESRLINKGNKMVLEIELYSTSTPRDQAAALALALHHLRPGQVEIVFINPSTEEI